MKKIAIIGYGAATVGYLFSICEKLEKSKFLLSMDISIDVFDKNSRQCAGGLGGLAYDGKLVYGEYAGTEHYVSIETQQKIVQFISSHSQTPFEKTIEEESEYVKSKRKEFYNNNMYLLPQKTLHLGTDQLHEVNERMLNYFSRTIGSDGIHLGFHFNENINVERLMKMTDEFDLVIVAVGRSGASLINDIITINPELVMSSSKVDIGIRFELPSELETIKRLDTELYEWKVKYITSNGLTVRTFCHNPHGFVVKESFDVLGEKISIVNGHSKKNEKSNNTNFAMLVTQEFTSPFNNSILYGKIVSQQANLLAGSADKVILQTLGDFKNKKRTKRMFRVLPTLPNDQYLLGDLTYALPARTYEAVIEFIDQLSIVVPEISNYDNLVYGVETKFYGTKLKNTANLAFIGDCSGHTRSIVSAACSGYFLQRTFNIKEKS